MAKLDVVIPSADIEVRQADGSTVKYRKVGRPARVGDVVRSLETDDGITKDAFYEVTGSGGGYVEFYDNDGDERYRDVEDYEVYEKVADSSDIVTHEGRQYRKVKRKANVGELVYSETGGKVYTVSADVELDDDKLSVGYVNGAMHRLSVLEPLTSDKPIEHPKPDRLKVGEYAKAAGPQRNALYRKEGDYVKIVEDDRSSRPFRTEHLDGSIAGWAYESDLVRATADEVAAALRKVDAPKPKLARIPVGSYVKILTDSETLPEGAIAKVTRDDGEYDIWPYKCELLDGSNYDWYKPEQIEAVTEEVVKWAAIGRNVNEYKTGDVVEVTRSTGYVLVGSIGVIGKYDSNDSFRVNTFERTGCNWHGSKDVKLVVPVEQRFDTRSEADFPYAS